MDATGDFGARRPGRPVRAAACRGLGLFAPDLGPAHVVGLVAALGDPADTVRVDALEALGELPTGPTAAAVSAATRLVRQGPTGEERRAAAALLSNGSALPDDAVRALIFAMTADVPTVQAAAAFALHVLLERGAAETQQRVSRALRALSPR